MSYDYELRSEFIEDFHSVKDWRDQKLVIVQAIGELIDRINDIEWELKEINKKLEAVADGL